MSDEVVNPTEEVAPAASFNEWLGEATGEQVEPAAEEETDDGSFSIITTSGGHFDVPVAADELLSVQEVLIRSRLTVSGAIEFWVNGVQVDPAYQVGPGARISVVGVVKGG